MYFYVRKRSVLLIVYWILSNRHTVKYDEQQPICQNSVAQCFLRPSLQNEDSWQEYLECISPFIVYGKGVWWDETNDSYKNFDGANDCLLLLRGSEIIQFYSFSVPPQWCSKLTALSLIFQRNVDLTIIQPQVNATVSSLKLLLNHPGPYMQYLDATLTQLSGSFNLTTTEKQASFKTNIHNKYLQNLISNLKDRVCDGGVLSKLAIFNSQKAKCCPSDQFSSYGGEEITIISEHFTTMEKSDSK